MVVTADAELNRDDFKKWTEVKRMSRHGYPNILITSAFSNQIDETAIALKDTSIAESSKGKGQNIRNKCMQA